MSNLITVRARTETMTLKDITDLLNVRHANAMRTVRAMSRDSAFGTITQIEQSYPMPNGANRPIETYQLDKRQSIAVAARLNVALLMRIVDRWQELEEGINEARTIEILRSEVADLTNQVEALKAVQMKAIEDQTSREAKIGQLTIDLFEVQTRRPDYPQSIKAIMQCSTLKANEYLRRLASDGMLSIGKPIITAVDVYHPTEEGLRTGIVVGVKGRTVLFNEDAVKSHLQGAQLSIF